MKRLTASTLLVAALWAPIVANAAPVEVDRVAVRYIATETGGVARPRFIFERELAFEARLEALGDPDHAVSPKVPYRKRHVRAALERHIAETLLESLEIEPEPSEQALAAQIESAKLSLYQRVGGSGALEAAARAEGIERSEIRRLVRRQARASLYLDRMVAPMLEPSEAELRNVHRTERTPFVGQPFRDVADEVRRWYVARHLGEALASFFEGARSRVRVILLQ